MHLGFLRMSVKGMLLASCFAAGAAVAQDLVFATGTLVTSGPAAITARPVGWSHPKSIDSAYTFQTGAGNTVAFSLPVGISNNSGLRPFPGTVVVSDYRGPYRDAAGRTVTPVLPRAYGPWFSADGPHISSSAGVARRAAVSLPYRFSVASLSPQYGDVANLLKTLAEKDNGAIDLPMPAKGGSAAERFKELLAESQYHSLFPNRFGFGKAGQASDGTVDFYSYSALIKAIENLAPIQVKIVQRRGVTYAQKVVWTDTVSRSSRTMITHDDYNAEWNRNLPEDTVGAIRYGDFCGEGTLETRKRELAAFFANVAHETTGGWSGAPNGGEFAWGLYWREEVAWQTNPDNPALGYVDLSNKVYPAVPGKSYHGRGPIQVSWNYNYGQASEFLYGDKNVLLQAPEKILASGDAAFMTAIWFWMYPQGKIPASHDIMTGRWLPNAEDIAEGRDKSRFGATINVVNGVQECGKGLDTRVTDRVGHFKRFSGAFGLSLEPVLDCYAQQPF